MAHQKDCNYQPVNRGGNEEFDCDCGAVNNQKWTVIDVGDIQDGIQDYETALWIHKCTKACEGINPQAIPAMVEALKFALRNTDKNDVIAYGIIEQALKQAGAL